MNWSENFRLRCAADSIVRGGVIAYPTEAVWGLGCLPDCAPAVARILQLKGRSVDKGLILVAADIAQLEPYLRGLLPTQLAELEASWPGPVTWLVPDNGAAPEWITGKHASLALRVSNHPVVAELCRQVGGPIVSTSANPQGRREARSRFEVRRYFGRSVDAICVGEVGARARPSQIRDLLTGRIIRG